MIKLRSLEHWRRKILFRNRRRWISVCIQGCFTDHKSICLGVLSIVSMLQIDRNEDRLTYHISTLCISSRTHSSFPAPSRTQSANSFLLALTSQNPFLSSNHLKGLIGTTPSFSNTLLLFGLLSSFSICSAQTRHSMGRNAGDASTIPRHRSETEKRVSMMMSTGNECSGLVRVSECS